MVESPKKRTKVETKNIGLFTIKSTLDWRPDFRPINGNLSFGWQRPYWSQMSYHSYHWKSHLLDGLGFACSMLGSLEKYSQMVVWGWFTMVESLKKLKQIQVEEIRKAVAIYDTLWQKLGTTLQRLQCGRKDFLSQSAVSLLCQWAQHVFRPGTLMTLLMTSIFFYGQGPPIFVSTHALVLIMSEWVHLPSQKRISNQPPWNFENLPYLLAFVHKKCSESTDNLNSKPR